MENTPRNGVITLDGSSESQHLWEDYVGGAPDASFYHRYAWKQINESEFGHRTFYLAHFEEGRVTGVFPLVLIDSRIFGRILCSLPFLNYCGPSSQRSEATARLLAEACAIADRESVSYLEIRSTQRCDDSLPVSTDKISLTVPLQQDPDSLWNDYTSKHRNNIRRAYKSGLRVEHGHLDRLDTFYDIMCHSWRALGTPIYRKRYFRSILEAFGDATRIFVVYHDDTPVATAFNGYHNGTVEGMWAGGMPEHRRLQSNYVLYWEMIKHACESGLTTFHLGRSSVDSGGETFKKKWGAEAHQLYWQYYLPAGDEIPQLNVKNPKYQLAINTWRRLPLWATRMLGPLLSRSIP